MPFGSLLHRDVGGHKAKLLLLPISRGYSVTLSILTVPSPKFSRITNWHHRKVLLNSFPMNGHTLEFCPLNQKLQNVYITQVFSVGVKGLRIGCVVFIDHIII